MLNNILAGPILRRTTPNRICVWLALDSEQDVALEILDMDENVVGGSKPEELKASRYQLGAKLFVYLLQAYSKDAPNGDKTQFPAEVPLYYRLNWKIDDKNYETLDLHKAGLTYLGHQYPIFHVPGELKAVLYGSCRKPHGVQKIGSDSDHDGIFQRGLDTLKTILGTNSQEDKSVTVIPYVDSLTSGDDLLTAFYAENTDRKNKRRQDVLLLTGDQIYADDVAASLLAVLRDEAVNLTGESGALPLREYHEPQEALTLATIPLCERAAALRQHQSGFSSGAAHNHLLSFGEFAAMYIYTFGNAKHWKPRETWADLLKDEKLSPEQEISALQAMFTWQEKLGSLWSVKSTERILRQKRQIIDDDATAIQAFDRTFANGENSLHKVRRLLANIPTYMIFDDHDVTDDWNITGHWYDKVRSSPLGRRIVSNALAAYWAFQGWGNDPDNFDAEMVGAITQHLNKTKPDPDCDERYDLLTWKHRGWSFSVPTSPPIIAIDSRTQRQSDNPFYPPRLLDRYALDWLRLEWSKLKTCPKSCHGGSGIMAAETCPVLIAATPVFGFSPVEYGQRLLVGGVSFIGGILFNKTLGNMIDSYGSFLSPALNKCKEYGAQGVVTFADAESWSFNRDGFADFLDTLLHKMGIRRCVFLSGDVHYAFSASGKYESRSDFTASWGKLNCLQLTSSALRNETSSKQKRQLKRLYKAHTGAGVWHKARQQLQKLQLLRRWEHELLPLAGGTAYPLVADNNLGEVEFDTNGPVALTLWHAVACNGQGQDKGSRYRLTALEVAESV